MTHSDKQWARGIRAVETQPQHPKDTFEDICYMWRVSGCTPVVAKNKAIDYYRMYTKNESVDDRPDFLDLSHPAEDDGWRRVDLRDCIEVALKQITDTRELHLLLIILRINQYDYFVGTDLFESYPFYQQIDKRIEHSQRATDARQKKISFKVIAHAAGLLTPNDSLQTFRRYWNRLKNRLDSLGFNYESYQKPLATYQRQDSKHENLEDLQQVDALEK